MTTSVQTFKRRADSFLVELFRSLFEEIDTEKLKAEVETLRQSSPDFDPIDHARVLSRRTAVRCAAAGAVSGVPGGLTAVATLGADLAYLMYQQFRLVLGIATIYGHEPSQKERFGEALTCIAFGSGVGLGKQGLTVMLESAAVAEGAVVAERIGLRFLRERVTRLAPVIGIVTGSMLNYFVVNAVGKATIRYYESKVDPALAEEIWLDGDREHA